MLGMSCRTRAVVAIGLVVAYASLPLALDVCAASCAAEGASRHAPSCHHAASKLPGHPRIGRAPVLCGHDHDAVRSAVASLKAPSRPSAPAQAVLNTPAVDTPARNHDWQRSAGPPLFPVPRLSAAPLRI